MFAQLSRIRGAVLMSAPICLQGAETEAVTAPWGVGVSVSALSTPVRRAVVQALPGLSRNPEEEAGNDPEVRWKRGDRLCELRVQAADLLQVQFMLRHTARPINREPGVRPYVFTGSRPFWCLVIFGAHCSRSQLQKV